MSIPQRKILAIISILLLGNGASLADTSKKWRFTYTLKLISSPHLTITLTSGVASPKNNMASCVEDVVSFSQKLEGSDGYIWTDLNYLLRSFEDNADAPLKHKVIKVGCSYEQQEKY